MYENSYAFIIIIKRIASTFFSFAILMVEMRAPYLTWSTEHREQNTQPNIYAHFDLNWILSPMEFHCHPRREKRYGERPRIILSFLFSIAHRLLVDCCLLSRSLSLSLPSVRRPFIFFWLQEKSCHIQLFLFKFLLAFIHKMIYLFPFAE